MVSYPGITPGVVPQKLATDAQGNYFVVGFLTTPSGRPQIHVDKTDPHGNALGSISFGGSNIGAGVTDAIGGVAVDPQGNLVIVGTTTSPDFPKVAPLTPSAQNGGAFVTKIDSQLKNIVF